MLEGTPAPIEGISDAICIRRTISDTLLTDAAAEAGAEVRQGFTVKELLWEDGRVVGIRGRDATGRTVEERAAIVIGADGTSSFVARAVDAPTYLEHPTETINVYSYWRGVDMDGIELYTRPGRFFVALPTNDELVLVAQIVPTREADRYKGRTEAAFDETLAEVPHLAERVLAGQRVERFRWAPVGHGFFRQAGGPGWALVGDSGYHKDPITAQGMADAFRDADLLAEAVDRGLDGDLAAELVRYQQARDTAALPMYEFTCGLADLDTPPTPEMLGLVEALEGNDDQIARFLGLIAGSVAIPPSSTPTASARSWPSRSPTLPDRWHPPTRGRCTT